MPPLVEPAAQRPPFSNGIRCGHSVSTAITFLLLLVAGFVTAARWQRCTSMNSINHAARRWEWLLWPYPIDRALLGRQLQRHRQVVLLSMF